jgi:hypothetical protein
LLILGCVLAGCSEALSGQPLARHKKRIPGQTASARVDPPRFFSPTSFWNQPLPANAPLAPSSPALVGTLDSEVAAEEAAHRGPWINTHAWSVPIYTVSARQPTVRVRLDGGFRERALQRAWAAVPLPPSARPAAGTDAHLIVWQPATDRLWEFWRLGRSAARGWSAAWGGAIRHVSENPGVYGPHAWPGARPTWGASATSLSIAGGLIRLDELAQGRIEHALAISLPNVRAGVYAEPARREDGTSTSPLALPEGARLRLPADLELNALHLPPLTLELARAAQHYGLVVRDKSSAIAFFAQDPVPTGTEPFLGATGYFEGRYPNELLASFPWSQLQVLALSLHTSRSRSTRRARAGRRECSSSCEAGRRPGG